MLKASALYLVIVIALVMAVLCSSLIVAAYFYKLQGQRAERYSSLQQHLSSAINIVLAGAGADSEDQEGEAGISLYGSENDTVLIDRHPWGIYELATVHALIQGDTLSRAFTLASAIDSASWSALYLVDEDRPLSLSGKTEIRGTVFLPKAGVKEAYISGKAYEGNKRLVVGARKISSKTLPALNAAALRQLERSFGRKWGTDSVLLRADSVGNSFLRPTLSCELGKKVYTISNNLSGNVVLHSDTTVVIAGTARLENVLIFARAIVVQQGFQGSCQLFARDSLRVEKSCRLDYPSALGVLSFKAKAPSGVQQKLSLGEGVEIAGSVFTYEKNPGELRAVVDLEKNVRIAGQLYAPGLMNFKDGVKIAGSVMAARFIYQTAYTRYENYLINISISGPALSPYYLTSSLLPSAGKQKKVLQWLN